jgi:hypothetical protein
LEAQWQKEKIHAKQLKNPRKLRLLMSDTKTADEVLILLKDMEKDSTLITKDAYSPNTALYPDNRIPFVDIHMAYLKSHKHVDPINYLSNLRLMIKDRAQ